MTRVKRLLDRQPNPVPDSPGQEICSYLFGYLSREDVSIDFLDALSERAAYGEAKHKFRLRSHNGRDPLADAFQEAVDLVFYMTQLVIETHQADWSRKLLWQAIQMSEAIIRADREQELSEVPEPEALDEEMLDLLDDDTEDSVLGEMTVLLPELDDGTID